MTTMLAFNRIRLHRPITDRAILCVVSICHNKTLDVFNISFNELENSVNISDQDSGMVMK